MALERIKGSEICLRDGEKRNEDFSLSSSGMFSLSDIVAATIGDMSSDSQQTADADSDYCGSQESQNSDRLSDSNSENTTNYTPTDLSLILNEDSCSRDSGFGDEKTASNFTQDLLNLNSLTNLSCTKQFNSGNNRLSKQVRSFSILPTLVEDCVNPTERSQSHGSKTDEIDQGFHEIQGHLDTETNFLDIIGKSAENTNNQSSDTPSKRLANSMLDNSLYNFVDSCGFSFDTEFNLDEEDEIESRPKRRKSMSDSPFQHFKTSSKEDKKSTLLVNEDKEDKSSSHQTVPDSSNLTPVNTRFRSLSEHIPSKEDLSPLGDSRLNTSFLGFLDSPSDSPVADNTFYKDLKSVLEYDCKKNSCPKTLFDTLSSAPKIDVYARERNLQAKFSTLQSTYPDEIRNLSSFYRYQSAMVETERFRELHKDGASVSYQNHLNDYYDNQLHMIMERVEKSVQLLTKANKEPAVLQKSFRSRPLLSRKAVRIMEEWYTRNYEHPYPGTTAVEAMAKAGEINHDQVKKWFANKRNRCKNTKPNTEVINMKRKRQFSSRW